MNNANTATAASATPLSVVLTVGYPPIVLYLQAKTMGLITLTRPLDIEVCGWETISNTDTRGIWTQYYKRTSSLSGLVNIETPSTNYELLFADDSPINCPITTWTLETTTDSINFVAYTAGDVTLDSVSKLMKV